MWKRAFSTVSTVFDFTDLGVKLGQEVKVFLQVGGKDGLDDQEAETLELHVVKAGQEVELRTRQEEAPR